MTIHIHNRSKINEQIDGRNVKEKKKFLAHNTLIIIYTHFISSYQRRRINEEATKKKQKKKNFQTSYSRTTLRIVENQYARDQRRRNNNNNNNNKRIGPIFPEFRDSFVLKKNKKEKKKIGGSLIPFSKRNQACNGSIGSRIVSRWFHEACFEPSVWR